MDCHKKDNGEMKEGKTGKNGRSGTHPHVTSDTGGFLAANNI
jgi:hypothetical protein